MKKFKVGIIGGGPGGYVAGIRLNQLEVSCVVFEKARLGGVCLNWGCIPTKAMVKVSEEFHETKKALKDGYFKGNIDIDFENIKERQDKIVNQLVGGIEHIYKKQNIDIVSSEVKSIKKIDSGYILTTDKESCEVDYVIIATGSTAKPLRGIDFVQDKILSSRDVISMRELPASMVIVGGGVIGCEFACIFNQLGVKVDVVEFLPRLLPAEDAEVSKRLTSSMKREKIKIHTKTAVEKATITNNVIELNLSNGKTITTDKVLLSVGRMPVFTPKCEDFALDMENGFVTIDDEMRTNNKKVFAIGDVTGKLMLAHTASKQGVIVAELIANEISQTKATRRPLEYINIPRCTFTSPEIGSAGYTEEEAMEKYEEIRTGKFMFAANGKALAMGNNTGFVKVVADAKSDKIVGMHIIGPNATELIAQGSLILGLKPEFEELKHIVTAHPTLSEAVAEAIEDLHSEAIHKI